VCGRVTERWATWGLATRETVAPRLVAVEWWPVVASVVAAGDEVPDDSPRDDAGVRSVGDVADELVSVDDGVVSPAQQRQVAEV